MEITHGRIYGTGGTSSDKVVEKISRNSTRYSRHCPRRSVSSPPATRGLTVQHYCRLRQSTYHFIAAPEAGNPVCKERWA